MGDNHYFDSGTSISMDACAIKTRDNDNKSIIDYHTFNYYEAGKTCHDQIEQLRNMQIQHPNLKYKIGYDISPCFVDKENKIAKMTHGPERQQLATRNFQAVPDLSKGSCAAGVEAWILQGSDTVRHRECERLTERDFDRMVPLNACMSDFVKNMGPSIPDMHSIGESSREIMRSSSYLNKCGYVHDGKNWLPKDI